MYRWWLSCLLVVLMRDAIIVFFCFIKFCSAHVPAGGCLRAAAASMHGFPDLGCATNPATSWRMCRTASCWQDATFRTLRSASVTIFLRWAPALWLCCAHDPRSIDLLCIGLGFGCNAYLLVSYDRTWIIVQFLSIMVPLIEIPV
jgi:hypothetical protein